MAGEETVVVVTLEEAEEDVGQMARDVRAGLATTPKDLSPWPKYFYDAEGSRLFEQITAQPEYYQTGAELSILVGEGVRTESSTKFTPDSAARTFEEAGLELLDLYTDGRNLFALGKAA